MNLTSWAFRSVLSGTLATLIALCGLATMALATTLFIVDPLASAAGIEATWLDALLEWARAFFPWPLIWVRNIQAGSEG